MNAGFLEVWRLPGWLAGRVAGQKVSVVMTPFVGPTRKIRILDSCRSGGFQAGWLAGRLAGQGVKGVTSPAVGPTRKTRILDSCRSGGFQAGWQAGWLARELAYL